MDFFIGIHISLYILDWRFCIAFKHVLAHILACNTETILAGIDLQLLNYLLGVDLFTTQAQIVPLSKNGYPY